MTALRLAHVLFEWVLQNSAGAAGVALLVLLAQWLLRGRISARWRHNLWLLVVARLLLPPMPAVRVPALQWPLARQSPTNAVKRPMLFVRAGRPIPEPPVRAVAASAPRPNPLPTPMPLIDWQPRTDFGLALPPQHEQVGHSTASGNVGSLTRERLRADSAALTDAAPPHVSQFQSQPNPPAVHPVSARHAVPWATLVVSGWIAGALVLLIRLGWNTARLWLATQKLPVVTDRSARELLEDCCRLMHAPRVPVLLEGPPDSGPALIGVLRPKLLLPPCVLHQFAWRELRLILLHELAHLRRGDVAVSYLLSMLQAIHWFNPLVWLAFARIRCERELACDEAVLRATPWREARAYGSVIVKLLEVLCHRPELAGAVGVIQTRELMHRRIAMIARFDGTRHSWSAGGVLLSLALGGAALISSVRAQEAPAQAPSAQQQPPAGQEPQEDAPPQNQKEDQDLEHARAAVNQQAQEPADEAAPAAGQPVDGEVVNSPADPAAFLGGGPGEPAVNAGAAPPEGAATPGGGALPPGEPAPPPPAPGTSSFGGGAGSAIPAQPGRGFGGGGFGRGSAQALPGHRGFGGMGGAGQAGVMMRGMGQTNGDAALGDGFYRSIEDTASIRADGKTLEKLQKPAELKVDQVGLSDVLTMVADTTGIDLVLDRKALEDAGIDQNTPVQANLREPRSADHVLQLALRLAGGGKLDYSIIDGVVMVSTKASLSRHLVTRIYDLAPISSSPQELSETIAATVAPDAWGRGSELRFFDGKLVVTASEPTQRQVEKFLALLIAKPGGARAPDGGQELQPMRGRGGAGLRHIQPPNYGQNGPTSSQEPRGSGLNPAVEPLQPATVEPPEAAAERGR